MAKYAQHLPKLFRWLIGEASALASAVIIILLLGVPTVLAYHFLLQNYVKYRSYAELKSQHDLAPGKITAIYLPEKLSWNNERLVQIHYQYQSENHVIDDELFAIVFADKFKIRPGDKVNVEVSPLMSNIKGIEPLLFNTFYTFILFCLTTLFLLGPTLLGLDLLQKKLRLIWLRYQLHVAGTVLDAQLLNMQYVHEGVLLVEYIFKEPNTDEIYESRVKVYDDSIYKEALSSGSVDILYNEANPDINCVKES